MVPASTLRYPSNFCINILYPQFFNSVPMDAQAIPFPIPDKTPQVMQMMFIMMIFTKQKKSVTKPTLLYKRLRVVVVCFHGYISWNDSIENISKKSIRF
jgi:hypothetical protein